MKFDPPIIILLGISGAGATTTLKAFEDSGFFTLGRLPIPFMEKLDEMLSSESRRGKPLVVFPDVKNSEDMDNLLSLLKVYGRENFFLLFLDADEESIIRRYSETRRPHPAYDPSIDASLIDTIKREREYLIDFKETANEVIDTSELTVHDLRRQIRDIASYFQAVLPSFRVNLTSFGFKYGAPRDCDLLVDVRFLPNPYFVDELRELTGLEETVVKWIFGRKDANAFLDRYVELLEFLIPKYKSEGKAYLNIGVGCTGGQHRSVAIAEKLSERISGEGIIVRVTHRDIS